MKKMYDLYETYVDILVDGTDLSELRTCLDLHFSFVSEYSKPISYSFEDGNFSIKKFFKTFVGPTYQQCLGLGDIPDTIYRFFVNFDEEAIHIRGTRSEFTIPFEKLSIEASGTRPIAERGTYTEEC